LSDRVKLSEIPLRRAFDYPCDFFATGSNRLTAVNHGLPAHVLRRGCRGGDAQRLMAACLRAGSRDVCAEGKAIRAAAASLRAGRRDVCAEWKAIRAASCLRVGRGGVMVANDQRHPKGQPVRGGGREGHIEG